MRFIGNSKILRLITALVFSILSLVFVVISPSAQTGNFPENFSSSIFVNGLSSPTAMAFAPDGRLFVAEQGGALRVVKNGTLLSTPFLTASVHNTGERGLLGVAFDPDFESNGFVYIYYTTSTDPKHNRVSRFTANGDVAVANSELILMDLPDLSSATNHNGGALHFGPDGKLYIAVGENANGSNAQSLNTVLGSILRINPDGSIPTDNPFYGSTSGDNRSIWAYGLRNPFTFAFQPGTGLMYINDVGQVTWEEINEGKPGPIMAGRPPKARRQTLILSRHFTCIRILVLRLRMKAALLLELHFTTHRPCSSRLITKESSSLPITATVGSRVMTLIRTPQHCSPATSRAESSIFGWVRMVACIIWHVEIAQSISCSIHQINRRISRSSLPI